MSDIDKINISGTDYTISVAPEGTLDNSSGNFTSGDGTTTSETYDNVPAITASQNHKTIFSYATRMIKNIRVLFNKITSLNTTVTTLNRTATTGRLGQVQISTGISVTSAGKISVNEDAISIAAVKRAIIDTIYPVGSIYLAYNNVNPTSKFGGTWSKISEGYVLATAGNSRYGDGGSVNTYSKEAQSTTAIKIETNNLPNHTHTTSITDNGHTHSHASNSTGSEPSHKHTYNSVAYDSSSSDDYAIGVQGGTIRLSSSSSKNTGNAGSHSHSLPNINTAKTNISVNVTGGGKTDPTSINVKPYTYTVYAWRRTG